MIETRTADGAGRGYFASEDIVSGTHILDRSCALVQVVKDEHERRNCRSCLQPVVDTFILDKSPRHLQSGSQSPICPKCLRSVLCATCFQTAETETADCLTFDHYPLECDSLISLSKLEKTLPSLAQSLLGGDTIYLRLLLRLLALRARLGRVRVTSTANCRDGNDGKLRNSWSAIEDLEDHLDDIFDNEELEARVTNTVRAAKMVAPAVWKASQEDCASFLGKL